MPAVVAAEGSPGLPPGAFLQPPSTDENPPALPGERDVREGREMVEREEAERQRWLDSPEAVRERERSRRAYIGLGSAEARELLARVFAGQLSALDADPGRFLTDAQLVRPLGEEETAATVRDEGHGSLLDAGVPVRTEDEQGQLRKVDLSLEAVPGGFEPINPLTELRIPSSASDAVEIGDEGLAISPVGVEQASSQLFGKQDAYGHQVLKDTGMVISPVSGGVELFDVLFSEESPETLRYEFDLPEGAELRAFGGGAAEVVRGADTLATVPPPTAVDAQGTAVPVEMTVDGETLVLHVAHREGDFAWPIMVDPAIWEDWYTANWFNANAGTPSGLATLSALSNGAWQFANNYGFYFADTKPIFRDWGGSHRGLFISTPNQQMAANTFGRWAYSAPNIHSYIEGASLLPFWVDNHNCSKDAYPQPDDYVGLWGDNAWNQLRYNDAYYQGFSNLNSWGRSLHIGLTMAGSTVQMPCWRDLYVGGALVNLNDWESPTLNSVSGAPTGWFGDSSPIAITANASDAGLGVQFVTITQEGKGVIAQERPGNCTGLYNSRCPTNHNARFNFTALSLGEGIRTLSAVAQDPTGKGSNSVSAQTMVDRSEPHVVLDGQLADATDEDEGAEQGEEVVEKLSLPVYNLRIEASDGNPGGEPKDLRSGVKDIKVFLDGKERPVPWSARGCAGPKFSCPMNVTYQLILTDLESGEHTLKVLVVDQVGNSRERTVEFEYLPATGMSEAYLLHHFPLADGGEPGEGPELAVNVMNGNLVYRETDVDVEGAVVDLEVERYYNSQLPDLEATEWGEGWTLAQTPQLEPEAGPAPATAGLVDPSGALDSDLVLPTEVGKESFDPELRATLKKDAEGYELRDETGGSAASVLFGESGRAEELRTEGLARIEYEYEDGELSELAVHDPGSAGRPSAEPVEAEQAEPRTGAPLRALYDTSFGKAGGADGQLSSPSDVAVDPAGNLWVVDKANNRVQRFGSEGGFLSRFGTLGSGNGQFDRPTAIAIDDASGDLLVADGNNRRVQRFDAEGHFLGKFGSAGTGNGQFGGFVGLTGMEGLAVDPAGSIWVSDTSNGRIEKFSSAGVFLQAVGSKGTAPGQLTQPRGLDFDAEGNLWVADSGNHRIAVFDSSGKFLRQFGSQGSGEGQLNRPAAVAVDDQGNVWVGDSENNRVQVFDTSGEPRLLFGSKGTAAGQFGPTPTAGRPPITGLEAEGGRAWIVDVFNNRVQHWLTARNAPPPEPSPEESEDPAVTVETDAGLVAAVEGEEAGAHSYEHDGNDLVSHSGPDGETTYAYDAKGRMTEVALPSGTRAQIAYNQIYGRVSSVTVDPAGSAPAKITEFEFSDEPRRTTVKPAGERRVFYDLGSDGSVLRWRNALVPPKLKLAGTLFDHREEEGGLIPGDHLLEAQAHSAEGIASVEVIVNGAILVDELHCDTAKPVSACEDQVNLWQTETGAHPPGRLAVEVLATDRLGQVASERFWVDIPEPPPPLAPGTPIPPKYSEIARFREERGLEVNFPVADEIELNERILDLITSWFNPQTPAGEVARASYNRWGVPLRAVDVAELEYRQWFLEVNGGLIEDWAEATGSTTFAGVFLDNRAGGLLRVGFTQDQQAQLDALENALPLVARDRLAVYQQPPTRSAVSLRSFAESVSDQVRAQPQLDALTLYAYADEAANRVRLGTHQVAEAQAAVNAVFGPSAPIAVELVSGPSEPLSGRFRSSGRMRAGDFILSGSGAGCTAGFGAHDLIRQKSNGQMVDAEFVLTAGHCGSEGTSMFRSENPGGADPHRIGVIARQAWRPFPGTLSTDAEAVRLQGADLVPRKVFGEGEGLLVRPPVRPKIGNEACFSGATTQNPIRCGPVTAVEPATQIEEDSTALRGGYWVEFDKPARRGDSGSPVWIQGNFGSVGLVTARVGDLTLVEPLLHPRALKAGRVPGILDDPAIAPITLVKSASLFE